MKIVLLGPPGAGKGSLAMLLNQNYHIPHISTGDILREQIKENTELGQKAKGYIDNGQLVPDELVIRLIENRLNADDKTKTSYLLDGFPRTRKQAEDLTKILKTLSRPVDYVFYLETSMDMILMRLSGRRICRNCGALFHLKNHPPSTEGICDSCGGELYQRPDDNEHTIKTRMDVYMSDTMPIIQYYEGMGVLKKIDGNKETDELQEILTKTFDEGSQFN